MDKALRNKRARGKTSEREKKGRERRGRERGRRCVCSSSSSCKQKWIVEKGKKESKNWQIYERFLVLTKI